MSPRILHVSDLHVGAGRGHRDPRVGEALKELVQRLEPELVVASGDLTHRGRPAQHDEAAALLRGLGRPLLVVPGNHDIPAAIPARFTHPWREFERLWGTTEPVHSTPSLCGVGLNSVRPWWYQGGLLGEARLARAVERLRAAEAGALRVAVLHHQLVAPPWRTLKSPVRRRRNVLEQLVAAGAELILSGHVHQSTVAERHEFEVLEAGARSVVVANAPGAGRPRPHRLGEAHGLLVHEADERELRVETHVWDDGGWRLVARRGFPRAV